MSGLWADVPRVRTIGPIDHATFEAEVKPAGRPVLVKGQVVDWPIVRAGQAGLASLRDHLLALGPTRPVDAWFAAPQEAGRFGYSPDVRDFNHQRRVVPLADLFAYMIDGADDPTAFSSYAGAIPLPQVLPKSLAELPMPLLDPGSERLTSLWLGAGSPRTAAHWDVPQNLACVVMGRRRFTLFPTEQVANLYVGPVDFTPAGQPISLVDFAAPDLDRFPRFADAVAHAEIAELEPGDMLYVPSLWWHHVETLAGPDGIGAGAMVNFWWRDGPPWLMTPLYTLFHALLTLRDLPAGERAAWRVMFDHYIFEANGDPMAHLPEGARGVFGPMTPDTHRRLKEIVAGPLVR